MAAHVRPSRGFCAVNPEDKVPTHEATMVAMARQLRPCNLSPETNMRCSATGARGARARVEGKQRAERAALGEGTRARRAQRAEARVARRYNHARAPAAVQRPCVPAPEPTSAKSSS